MDAPCATAGRGVTRGHAGAMQVPGLHGAKMSSSEDGSKIDVLDGPAQVAAKAAPPPPPPPPPLVLSGHAASLTPY